MGISDILKINFCFAIGGILFSHLATFSFAQDTKSTQPKNLADAFGGTQPNSPKAELVEEVEPIVVGREKWDSPSPAGSNAKLDDNNKDGISGKASIVFDELSEKNVLGRFGWKSSQPSILQQTTDAAYHDMGLSNTFSSKYWKNFLNLFRLGLDIY